MFGNRPEIDACSIGRFQLSQPSNDGVLVRECFFTDGARDGVHSIGASPGYGYRAGPSGKESVPERSS